jgi:hypothetical protein
MNYSEVLSDTYEWVNLRIETLNLKNRKEDADSLRIEFYEWLNEDISCHDIFFI